MLRLRVTLLWLVASGCTPQTGVGGPCVQFQGQSEEPCEQQIYFPSGLAVDPDGDVLYVASSNADLRYSGGSVQSIDLVRFDCAARTARDGMLPADCSNLLFTVTGSDGKPSAPTLLSDPDPRQTSGVTLIQSDTAGCTHDLLDPQIIACDEAPFITSGVKIGNFSGLMRIQNRRVGDYPISVDTNVPDAGIQLEPTTAHSAFNRRLWLPVRGDPSITFINVLKSASSDGGNGNTIQSSAHLDCTDPSNSDPVHVLDSCNNQRITIRDFHRDGFEAFPSCTMDEDCPAGSSCSSGTCETVPLPPEPFGLFLDEGAPNPAQNNDPSYSRLLVSHLAGGEVTLINSAAANPASTDTIVPLEHVVEDVRNGFFIPDASGRENAFALAPLTPGDPNSFWYLTSSENATVAMFRVSPDNLVLEAGSFSVAAGPYLTGADIRDLSVQADGTRAFFIDNQPPSLFTVDTRTISTGGADEGFPANQVVDIVDVCQGPSNLATRTFVEPGASGSPPRTVTRVYVICFITGQVAVVDPDLAIVVDDVLVGSGPNDIAFNFGNPPPPPPALPPPLPAHLRAYVANYTDSSVAVIDLDRGSPTENRVIFRIGQSQPPVSM